MRLKRNAVKTQQAKPLPFTETEIRERAYQLWQANPERSAEAHWKEAIEALRRERSLLGRVGKSWRTAFNSDNRDFSLDVLKFVVSSFGVLATIFAGVGLYLTYRTGQAQLESAQQERQLNTERLVTDRFAKAVEQLGSPDVDVRIGGIYSLERIAKDSTKDHWTIMEVLAAFVRTKSPLPKGWRKSDSHQKLAPVTTDVQSALTVIGRREVKNDPEGQWLDLTGTNLKFANFSYAHLGHVNFSYADFFAANLWHADFYKSLLLKAGLKGVYSQSTSFYRADLGDADLRYAVLEDTDFRSADGITPAQIKTANHWQKAHYDPEFRQQLGLPPEAPKP